MKFRFVKYLSAVILAAFTFVGCESGSDDEGLTTDVTLNVSPSRLSLTADAQSKIIAVTTDAEEWGCMSTISWVDAECVGQEINLSIAKNHSTETRVGQVVVYATSGTTRVEKKVIIEQYAAGSGDNGGSNGDFECAVFEELMLSSYDSNGDGKISEAEAARVTEIDVAYTESDAEERQIVTSLKGIKMFKNLQYLYCDNNLISTLDLSGMEKLEYVDCYYNEMTSLDVSNCPSLKWVYCYSNSLTKLNISGSENIMFLQAYKNKLTSIDVSGMKELVYFDVLMNELRDVDFSNCPKLMVAAVGSNNLISLKLEGLPSLYSLGCYENNIASLDLSKISSLEMLECYSNNIASLDLSTNPNLTALTCQRNMLTSLNIENCKSLAKLDCSNNFLSGDADFSGFTALKKLNCGANRYTSINVNACLQMEDLSCENTQITELEVSALSSLTSLIANDCLISKMDCSNNLKLKTLYLQGNPLTELVLAQGQSVADLKVDNFDVISYK